MTKRKSAIQAKGGAQTMAWMQLDDTGRILAAADPPYHCGDGEVELTLPPAAEGGNLRDWVWRDGVWVNEPEPEEVLPDTCFRMSELIEILMQIHELTLQLTMQMQEFLEQHGKG